jgi:hypothetical protein
MIELFHDCLVTTSVLSVGRPKFQIFILSFGQYCTEEFLEGGDTYCHDIGLAALHLTPICTLECWAERVWTFLTSAAIVSP